MGPMGSRGIRVLWAAALIGAALLAAPAAQAQDDTIVGKAFVVDANVLTIKGKKVRLFGIDAPDRKQSCTSEKGGSYPCGVRAANALDMMVRGKEVRCEPRGIGADHLVLATCSLAGLDLASGMVEAGWATANTLFAPQYAATQDAAKTAKAGLWQGEFQPPAEWRAEHNDVKG